jgi:hypothetical protein
MPCPKDNRVDRSGRARAGSQMHIQSYVNDLREKLSEMLIGCLDPSPGPSARLVWVSPLRADRYNEYRDEEFLEKLGWKEQAAELKKFWPVRGPCWDALGVVSAPNFHGAVLVEAKSHFSEMQSSLKAKSPRSREMIEKALAQAAQDLGVQINSCWTEGYYQAANRYAHLYFLRRIARLSAWLVNVYFTNDRSIATPLSRDQWQEALKTVKQAMGFGGRPTPFAPDLFLEAINI